MTRRGAIILSEGNRGAEGAPPLPWRFGEQDLLARLVAEIRPVLAEMVVLAPAGALSPLYCRRFLEGVAVHPLPEQAGGGAALWEGAGHLGEDCGSVAVMRADLPYLTAGFLEEMFAALTPEVEGVGLAEGSRRMLLPAVYRRGRLSGLETRQPPLGAGSEWLWEGGRMTFLQAEPLQPGGPTAATPLDNAEEYRRALAHFGFCDADHPAMTLELYGSLRIKTGCALLPLHAERIETAFAALRRIFPEAERILPEVSDMGEHFRFSVNGRTVTTDLAQPLSEGDHLILFSASVGG